MPHTRDQWLRLVEQHNADSDVALAATYGDRPDGESVDYLLRVADIRARLAQAASAAAAALSPSDEISHDARDEQREKARVYRRVRQLLGDLDYWEREEAGPIRRGLLRLRQRRITRAVHKRHPERGGKRKDV